MNGTIAYALSKQYVSDTAEGLGAVKGANCTIKSTTKIGGDSIVTFEWTGTSGTKQTSSITVSDGVSITSIDIDSDNNLVCTMSDGTEYKSKIDLLDNVYTKSETNTLLLDKAEKNHNHDSAYASKDTEHEHSNKETLDKFGVNDGGKLTFNGDVVTPEAMDLGDYLKKTDAQNTYVEKETGKGLSENDFTTVLKDAYDKAVEDSHTHSNKSIIDKFSEDSDGKLLYDGQSIEADLSTVYKKTETYSQTESDDKFVAKESGKGLSSNDYTTEEKDKLASLDNYDDTQVKTQIQAVANGLMDSVGYSADYKTIDIIAKNGVKKSVNVAPIISHASITELSDVDTTNKATGKALVYNATTSKHEYADVSGTDEKVKMDASTDAKYLGELLDNVTIANENGELKVKKLDGQEVTITEINYLKGLTMNVMDLVNMFSNGGVKIINTPVATYAELLTLDKSSFIEGVSYLVYVLADENHDNAKTTYLVDKDSETPTYFGFADSQRDFTTNPIDLATEITGKLGISNMDSDAIKALFTVDDTYKTETATNNAFSTHGAKALYDELLLAIGNKANDSDLTAHKDDTDIHVSTEDRTNWDSAKTHADSAHAPSDAQANVLETVKVNGTALEVSNKAVNVTVPTTVAQLTDSSSYAKKTDIPTTLPANGGNADTVNNHTVETDVPVDAVFTDTVYDDTEVKEDISKLNSNLVEQKMLGWNVPSECPIQNYVDSDGVFHQKVGRVDLGSLEWNYATNPNRFNADFNSVKFVDTSTPIVAYSTKYDIYSFNTAIKKDKAIGVWGSNSIASFLVALDSSYTDATTFKNAMKGIYLYYELATPITKTIDGNEAVEELSSNLSQLEFGEVAGVRNLFEDEIKWMENIPITRGTKSVSDGKITLTATSADCYTDHDVSSWKNNGIKTIPCKPNTKYTFSWEYEGDSVGDIYIFENGSTNNMSYTINKEPKLTITTSADAEYLIVRVGVRDSGTSITYWNFQLEEGDTATSYEPYIPSVKMLAEENAQQNTEAMDLKMLGWSVPSECPIQNYVDGNGVFHQRVGRVDLGNLDWSYSSDNTRFSTTEIIDYKKKDSSTNTWVANAFLKGYNTVSGNNTASDSYDKSIGFNGINDMFFVRNTSYTDATSFKNAMQGQYLYYELATEISMNVDGNEAVTKVNDSLSVIGKCKNLLKPVFVSGWGCNCVIGDDGKITLTSTNTEDYQVVIGYIHKCSLKANKTYYFRAFDIINIDHIVIGKVGSDDSLKSFYNQLIYTPTEDMDIQLLIYFSDKTVGTISSCYISVSEVYTDEYVPYTGDGETLTHDVANLRGSLNELSTYSTEEQIAGTYLDGKTIYRRSLEIPLDGELQKTLEFVDQGITALEGGEDISIYINQITPGVNLSEWNIDTMVKVYGHITDYTDTTKTEKNVDIPYPVTFNSKAYVTGWYNYKTKLYVVRVGEQYANKSTAFLTFEYTKV